MRVRDFKKINKFPQKSCRDFESYIREGDTTVWFGKVEGGSFNRLKRGEVT